MRRLDGPAPPSPTHSAQGLGQARGSGRWEPTLCSQGTSGRILTPLLARWREKGAFSASTCQQRAQLLRDHHVPLVPDNRLSFPGTTMSHRSLTTGSAPQGSPCPVRAVFLPPRGNHRATVFQAPPDTRIRFIHAPALVRTQAPAASMTCAAGPQIWKGHRKQIPRATGRTEPPQPGCSSPTVELMGDKLGAWHLTKPQALVQ